MLKQAIIYKFLVKDEYFCLICTEHHMRHKKLVIAL
jgi:hypothetical protein